MSFLYSHNFAAVPIDAGLKGVNWKLAFYVGENDTRVKAAIPRPELVFNEF